MTSLLWIAVLFAITAADVDTDSENDRDKRAIPQTTDCRSSNRNRNAGTMKKMYHTLINRTVLCDIADDGGGWVVFQRRRTADDASFNTTWTAYRDGFGPLLGNFWLGNEDIHRLSSDGFWHMKIDLTTHVDGQRYLTYADYTSFKVDSESENYKLHLGFYSGTVGESAGYGFSYSDNASFSTYDRDNDEMSNHNCALGFGGGWWYKACHRALLNPANSMIWTHFNNSETFPSKSVMKMRRQRYPRAG